MKKTMLTTLVVCTLLAGCGAAASEEAAVSTAAAETTVKAVETEAAVEETEEAAEETEEAIEETEETVEETEDTTAAQAESEPAEEGSVITPLPDTTMDNIDNATLAVSLEEGDVYADDSGSVQMDLKIYGYELFDMVDIAGLEVGDTIMLLSEAVVVETLEKGDTILRINGGLEEGGYELITRESGVYYEFGFDDAKAWYQVGECTFKVSPDFEFADKSDFEKGETVYHPEDFLTDETEFEFNFTPYDTTVRVEDGEIVFMEKLFIP